MTIESAIEAGFNAVSTGIRALHLLVSGSAKGDLAALTTISKTSLLSAVNEIVTGENVGFRYTFNMAAQPRLTWVQATGLTSVWNTAGSQISLNTGTGAFTFAAGSVANVARNWLFYLDCFTPTQDGISIAAEVRIGGVSIGRNVVGGVTGMSSGVFGTASLSVPYKIAGGEVLTFNMQHKAGSTAALQGNIYGVAL